MMVGVIGLAVAYAVVAALTLNLNLATAWSREVKAGALIVVGVLFFVSFWSLKGMLGWPASADLPAEFRLHWIMVVDPDKVTGDDGSIYFWVRELDAAGIPIGEPRAHSVIWSERGAEEASEALARLQGGEPLNGFVTREMMDPAEGDTMEIEGEDYLNDDLVLSGEGGARLNFEFRRAPLPTLPPKEAPL